MLSYILRRLLLVIPTVVGITLLVFGVMAMSPGGLASSLRDVQGDMRPEQRAVIEAYYNKRYGLNLPWYQQYLRWLNQVLPVGFKPARIQVSFEELRGELRGMLAAGKALPDAIAAVQARRPLLEAI